MSTPTTIRAFLRSSTSLLQKAEIDSPGLSAELLLAHALGLQRSELLRLLILEPDSVLKEETLVSAEDYLRRRAEGEPAAYITGVKEFYGLPFAVSPSVLIPRPETEMLVDLALEYAEKNHADKAGYFADFGTGSGCIAVTLALRLPHWRGIALDRSASALTCAANNARTHKTCNLGFVQADFSHAPLPGHSLDIVVSNPPYVSEAEYRELSREVRSFEPKSALVPDLHPSTGEVDCEAIGLEAPRTVITEAGRVLKAGGVLLMELGCTQGRALLHEMYPGIWEDTRLLQDLAGLDRVIWARRNASW